MKVISHLQQLMSDKGIDQKTLALKTGLSPTTVGKVYHAQFNRIDNQTIKTLCLYFGLKSISELIEIQWERDDVEGVQV